MKQFPNHLSSGTTKIPSINISKEAGSGAWGILSGSDASLFSSSLPVLPHEKLNLNESEHGCQSVEYVPSDLEKFHQDMEGNDPLEDLETHAIGSLLPDDEEELLAGIMDDFDLNGLPGSLEDLEEYNIFESGGGMELEIDPQESLSMGMSKISLSDGVVGNGISHYAIPNGVGTVAGEHPYGEHPSRTLFVRNINSNVEDSELKALFEQYGDIRTLYTACKHRGFVMISYFDIRAARTAMRALQNKPLRRRKLDIHFSIPKDNPSDKDINQGTLVVFNLDPSVSNEDLRQIFGAYGEVKEIRETPHKRHHKFIEFYDVRAAEAALKSLNRSDIAGKRIKLEPSRPGGARRNLMLQLNQELEQDESRSFRHQVGSPIANSPPGNWAQFNGSIENSMPTISKSPVFRTISPTAGNHLPGLASILHPQLSSSVKVAPIGKDQGRVSHVDHIFTSSNSAYGAALQQSHSFPEPKLDQYHQAMPSFGPSTSNGSAIETLSGQQFLWGNPNPYPEPTSSSAWPSQSVGHPYTSNGKGLPFQYSGRHGSLLGSSQPHHHHHVGSAPSGVPFERHFGFFPESPETSLMSPVAYGGVGLGPNDGNFMVNMGVRAGINPGINIPGSMSENGSSSFRIRSSPRLSPVFLGNGLYPAMPPSSMEGLERGRSRRVENQVDSKKQFQLDLDKIKSGEDARTTLMIKNIPNKYTSKMLLAAIDGLVSQSTSTTAQPDHDETVEHDEVLEECEASPLIEGANHNGEGTKESKAESASEPVVDMVPGTDIATKEPQIQHRVSLDLKPNELVRDEVKYPNLELNHTFVFAELKPMSSEQMNKPANIVMEERASPEKDIAEETQLEPAIENSSGTDTSLSNGRPASDPVNATELGSHSLLWSSHPAMMSEGEAIIPSESNQPTSKESALPGMLEPQLHSSGTGRNMENGVKDDPIPQS